MYRQNIFEFVEDGEKTLFIPKNGGLYDYVVAMLPEIGINVELELQKRKRGDVTSPIRQDDLEIILARGEDIPKRVEEYNEQGRLAYGITGDDLFDEYMLRRDDLFDGMGKLVVLDTYDWFDEDAEFKRPALCLMNKTGKVEDIPQEAKVATNAKYWMTTEAFLYDKNKFPVKGFRTRDYAGDTEASVSDGTNDCCVEVVYGGKTRRNNGLSVVDIVRFSDIVLIGEDKDYLGKLIMKDWSQIQDRKANPLEGSYTTDLLQSTKARRDKIISEAAEVFSAMEGAGKLSEEIPDLLYAIGVIVAGSRTDYKEIGKTIEGRLWKRKAQEVQDARR